MRVLIMKQLVIWRSLRRALSYRISSSYGMFCALEHAVPGLVENGYKKRIQSAEARSRACRRLMMMRMKAWPPGRRCFEFFGQSVADEVKTCGARVCYCCWYRQRSHSPL